MIHTKIFHIVHASQLLALHTINISSVKEHFRIPAEGSIAGGSGGGGGFGALSGRYGKVCLLWLIIVLLSIIVPLISSENE